MCLCIILYTVCVYFRSFLITFIFILKDQILFTAFTYNLGLPTVSTILNEFYIKVPNVFMMCLLLLGIFFYCTNTKVSVLQILALLNLRHFYTTQDTECDKLSDTVPQ